jgi:GxxExxY protein
MDTKEKLSEIVLGCAIRVHKALGPGFLEKVHENALIHELRKAGLAVRQQVPIPVRYDGIVVGDYLADLIVEGKLLVELKAISHFADEHTAICLNYLHAADLPVRLLLNFGKTRLDIKRLVSVTYTQEQDPI